MFILGFCDEFSDDLDSIFDNSNMLFRNFGNNGHFLTVT
jgi:hypothetical protein